MSIKNSRPSIRFSEFNEPWVKKRVDEVLVRHIDPVQVKHEETYKQIGIRSHGKGIFHKKEVSGKTLGNKRVFWLKKNLFVVNIVFAWEQAIAKTSEMEEGLVGSHRFPLFIPQKEQLDLDFILYFFLRKKGKNILELASPGGAGRNKTLGQKEFAKSKLEIPSFQEQKKIAFFLSAIDKQINLLEQKKIKLEAYKKSIIEQIFNQDISFKSGNEKEFPRWKKKKLGEIGIFSTSSVDKLTKPDEEEVFLVNYMNVYRHENISNETLSSLQKVTATRNQIQNNNLIKGDILFTPSSETPADIGHSIVIPEDLPNTLYSYHLLRFRPFRILDIGYSHYFCNTPKVRRQLSRLATGSTRFTISSKNFQKIKIEIPSLEEQKKIAAFLTSLDDQIKVFENQLVGTKQFKKGLLQQMFV